MEEDNIREIPKPEDTGSDGTQKVAGEVVKATSESPVDGLPIAQRVEGLAATKYRSMGGEVAAGLMAGCFSQLSHELQETKKELKETRNDLSDVRDELSKCKERAAVLSERVQSNVRGRHLRNICITVGTALIGFAVELMRNKFDKFSYVSGFLGFLLILFGWFSINGQDKE